MSVVMCMWIAKEKKNFHKFRYIVFFFAFIKWLNVLFSVVGDGTNYIIVSGWPKSFYKNWTGIKFVIACLQVVYADT